MKFKSSQEREKFILDNIKLCGFTIHKYGLYKISNRASLEDIYQESIYALITAVDRFDESKGFSFSTYAISCIKLCLLTYIKLDTVIRPKRISKSKNRKQGYEEPPSVISLDQTIKSRENEQCNKEHVDNIIDDKATDQLDSVLDKLVISQFFTTYLNNQDIKMLELKLKLFSQQDIAKILGISQPTVSKNLKKIKNRYHKFMQREE